MAYTSIIPVHRLDNSIHYIRDKEKTTKGKQGADSLEDAIGYALNREKTEEDVYEDSIGCICSSAYEDMLATKRRFHKTGGVQGYHLIQSFAEGEVTPELAHAIGLELAERLLQGRYEVVVATHLNTGHYHNHLVFNSVSMTDGRKYHSNGKSYYEEVRRISDGLCLKYGLSVIEPSGGKGKCYAEWQAEKEGRPTWRTAIRMDIREAVAESFTWKQFISRMEKRGYEWKLNRKYIALRAPGMERYVRLKSLGKPYSENSIREQILRPKKREWKNAGEQAQKRKLHGLQALYYSYLYQMGVLKERPKYPSPILRADIRRLDEKIVQMEFLQKNHISTREELAAYRKPLEEKTAELIRERQGMYRREPGCERLREITGELKPLRKEIRMCVRIEKQSVEMEQRLRAAEKWESGKATVEKETAKGAVQAKARQQAEQERR